MAQRKRLIERDFVMNALCTALALYLRFVYATSRWTIENRATLDRMEARTEPYIIVFWHGRMLPMPRLFRKVRPIHVLISEHRDGEIITRVINRLGIDTIRGSSARKRPGDERAVDKGGSAALRAMVRMLRKGEVVAITPDGPRGPRMRLTDGTLILAQLSGVPLVFATAASSTSRTFKSWDRFHFILPFGRVRAVVADPIKVPASLDAGAFERLRQDIETKFNALTAACDRAAGLEPVMPAPAEPIPEAVPAAVNS